jgi:hypothetical protein
MKDTKKWVTKFELIPYGERACIEIIDSGNSFIDDYIKGKFNDKLINDGGVAALAFLSDTKGFQIIFSLKSLKKDPVEIISHESLHMTSMVLRNKGIEHNEDTEEAYAYMTGYLSSKIYKLYEKACKDSDIRVELQESPRDEELQKGAEDILPDREVS